MKNFITHLKIPSTDAQGPAEARWRWGISGLQRVFLRQRRTNSYRTLIESTFTVWPSIVPDTVAVAFLLSGLPFKAVDALALPEASSL